jgi:hypothetical protein
LICDAWHDEYPLESTPKENAEMKLTHCFLAIALVCGFTSAAMADPLDFHMVVLDPPGFNTDPIFTTPFTLGFSTCAPGQLPTNTLGTYKGCFSGVNRSGSDWTSLELVFGNNSALSGQPAGCALDGGGADLYAAPSPTACSLQNESQYVLIYTGGAILNNENFVIAEEGVDPSAFPDITASVNTAATPEPESIWLLATGVLMTGFYFASRQKQTARTPYL